MAERRRKMLMGIQCDKYGNPIGYEEDYSREFFVIDIDNLRLQKVKEKNLCNLERNHNVNFMIMPDGIRFMTPNTGFSGLAKYCEGEFMTGITNNRYILLGVVIANQKDLVGYNVYDCLNKRSDIVMVDVDSGIGCEAGKILKYLGNAEWVQLALYGFIYNWESYPRFYI